MALKKLLILRKLPTGPRFARPEDRLRGCLKGRTAPIRQICNSFTRSKVGIEAPRLAAVAPCSSQGQALDPAFARVTIPDHILGRALGAGGCWPRRS